MARYPHQQPNTHLNLPSSDTSSKSSPFLPSNPLNQKTQTLTPLSISMFPPSPPPSERLLSHQRRRRRIRSQQSLKRVLPPDQLLEQFKVPLPLQDLPLGQLLRQSRMLLLVRARLLHQRKVEGRTRRRRRRKRRSQRLKLRSRLDLCLV
jgi:hypothetical protein